MFKVERVLNFTFKMQRAILPSILRPSTRLIYRNISIDAQETSKDPYETDFNKNFIPTNIFQKMLLSAGAATMSIVDPYRADMIACLGETTGIYAANYILETMESSSEGRKILKNKPRINSNTIDLSKLSSMPEGTLGKVYSNFLEDNKVTPDTRDPVRFVDDMQLSYVIQRYREAHDLVHAVLGMKTNMLGEVAIKWVEAIQTKLPMCISAAIFGPLRLPPKHRQQYQKYYLPWAIETGNNAGFLLNVYYEERWEQSIDELHRELNIKPLVIPK